MQLIAWFHFQRLLLHTKVYKHVHTDTIYRQAHLLIQPPGPLLFPFEEIELVVHPEKGRKKTSSCKQLTQKGEFAPLPSYVGGSSNSCTLMLFIFQSNKVGVA